jgi:ABC-2 type transport system permease protein
VTSAFVRQLRWELRKLWRRPRTYVGFGAALGFELGMLLLLQLPVVRESFTRRVWRLHRQLDIREPFSALSSAVEVAGQTMLFVGAVAIATVAADLVAREVEDGTLRMALCRPVSRSSVLAQKLVALFTYTVALVLFVGTTTLAASLLFEAPGQLVVVSTRESVLGVHELWPGLARYAASVGLLAVSMSSVACLAFTVSCFRIRATTATMIAIVLLLGDWIVHTHPVLAPVSPYTLMTRIASWRQVFNEPIVWLRLARNYTQLALLDAGLVVTAWLAFRWGRLR